MAITQSGCISEKQVDPSYPISPDPTKLEAVEPDKTKQAEILEWFGPPQFTYDGDKKELKEGDPDEMEGIVPKGMIALGYYNYEMEFDTSTENSPQGVVHTYQESIVSKEKILFLISKKDGVVRKVDRAMCQGESDV